MARPADSDGTQSICEGAKDPCPAHAETRCARCGAHGHYIDDCQRDA